jgi:hypothetical protein
MKSITVALACMAMCIPMVSQAKEGGDQSTNGAESWAAGALPPAGDYFLNYAGYWSGDLRDGGGHKVDFGGGQRATLNATYDAMRWVHVTDRKLLGADYGFHVIVPVVNLSVSHPAFGGRESRLGVGDIVIDPIVLGWHRGDWHTTVGLDIFVPVGHYDENDPRVSIGANYWSFEPVAAVSWLPASGWEASAKVMYNIKTRNDDTQYQSGDELHVDWLLGRTMGQWGLGVAGYYLKQTSSDEVDGQRVAGIPGVWSAGRRGEVFAYGPSVKYTTTAGVMLIGQWAYETHVRNRFGGDKFLFKAVVPF